MASDPRLAAIAALLGTCALALMSAGCAQKKVSAAAPVSAAPAPASAAPDRPMNAAPDTSAEPPAEVASPPPALPAAADATPPTVPIPAKKPAAPRRPAAEQPAVEASSEPAAHSPIPQISPEISPRDQASYERSTGDDISVAEKNLENVRGKQLNAAQQDMVGKIRSFLADSRQAGKDGDWARAQTLAQKARLLSVELINSL